MNSTGPNCSCSAGNSRTACSHETLTHETQLANVMPARICCHTDLLRVSKRELTGRLVPSQWLLFPGGNPRNSRFQGLSATEPARFVILGARIPQSAWQRRPASRRPLSLPPSVANPDAKVVVPIMVSFGHLNGRKKTLPFQNYRQSKAVCAIRLASSPKKGG
jgi:hypothetical protein